MVGELRLGPGGEGSGLFVAHADPLDALVDAHGIGDGVECIADDSPRADNPEVRQ